MKSIQFLLGTVAIVASLHCWCSTLLVARLYGPHKRLAFDNFWGLLDFVLTRLNPFLVFQGDIEFSLGRASPSSANDARPGGNRNFKNHDRACENGARRAPLAVKAISVSFSGSSSRRSIQAETTAYSNKENKTIQNQHKAAATSA